MKDVIYSYDIDLYNRNFLNCAQRHSLVMLKERNVDVEYLFYNNLISTDQILEQTVLQHVPKYDFVCESFSNEDFCKVGVIKEERFVDSFSEARSEILERIDNDGFVLLAGDVFYFPHCPEYLNKHLFHLVILKGYNSATGLWQIVDDNPASVLCEYQYPDHQVAAFYENNSVREYRCYEQVKKSKFDIVDEIGLAFTNYMSKYTDSRRLLVNIGDFLDCPWINKERAFSMLHDAFSLLSGSRICLAKYLDYSFGQQELADYSNNIARLSAKVRNMLVQAKVTGVIKKDKLKDRCLELHDLELELFHGVRNLNELQVGDCVL